MALTEEQRQALGEKMSHRGAGRSKVNPEDVAKRYLSGERVKDIADSLGVMPETIYAHLRKARDGK